jgi:hypothetical protein
LTPRFSSIVPRARSRPRIEGLRTPLRRLLVILLRVVAQPTVERPNDASLIQVLVLSGYITRGPGQRQALQGVVIPLTAGWS